MSGIATAVVGEALGIDAGDVLDVLPGIGSVRAGKEVAEAEKESARLQAQAAERALEFQKEQYADIKPYLMRGMEGYQNLLESPEAYKETPGYMFRLQEGLKAIGIPEGRPDLTGAQIKAATRYGQDYATSEYQNALARYAGLSELAQGVGGVSSRYASNVGNLLMGAAQARARGVTGAAQARASGNIGAGRDIMAGLGMLFGGPMGAIAGPGPGGGGTYGAGAGYGPGGGIYSGY